MCDVNNSVKINDVLDKFINKIENIQDIKQAYKKNKY